MKKFFLALGVAVSLWAAPFAREAAGVVYTDIANVFTANQRINAGVGINIAPGATGTLSLSDGIFERSRAAKMGDWTAVSYSGGNFTSQSGTWTVASGDQVNYAYMIVGHTMSIAFVIDASSVSGATTELYIAIPGGFTAKGSMFAFFQAYDNSTSVGQVGVVRVSASDAVIRLQSSVLGGGWVASTDQTFCRGIFTFEVN